MKRLRLAEAFVDGMKAIGIEDAYVDEFSIVYGTMPVATKGDVKFIGSIVYVSTPPDMSGRDIKPRIVESYDGSGIMLNEELGIRMGVHDFACLQEEISEDLIVTDGTTLLRVDDKAGITGIMTMVETLLRENREHGKIYLVFTPNEEVDRGTDYLRIPEFDADIAYTVDGGEVDCMDYESFNAVNAGTQIQDLNIHSGSVKDKVINALLVVMEFHSMLPVQKNPAHMEGYEGFRHLTNLHGGCEYAYMSYIIRNHSEELSEQQEVESQGVTGYLNQRYPENTIQLQICDSYTSIRTIIEKDIRVIELVKTSMKQTGLEPRFMTIRGGTDDVRLTYDSLPCPSLGTGGYDYYGKHELASTQEMRRSVELLLKIVGDNVQEV